MTVLELDVEYRYTQVISLCLRFLNIIVTLYPQAVFLSNAPV